MNIGVRKCCKHKICAFLHFILVKWKHTKPKHSLSILMPSTIYTSLGKVKLKCHILERMHVPDDLREMTVIALHGVISRLLLLIPHSGAFNLDSCTWWYAGFMTSGMKWFCLYWDLCVSTVDQIHLMELASSAGSRIMLEVHLIARSKINSIKVFPGSPWICFVAVAEMQIKW